MKRFTLLLCLLAVIIPLSAKIKTVEKEEAFPDRLVQMHKAATFADKINKANDMSAPLWRYREKTVYARNPAFDADSWVYKYGESYSYYADGKLRSKGDSTYEIVYFYDDKGRLSYTQPVDHISGLEGAKTVFIYDDVLENLIVRTEVIEADIVFYYSGKNIERDNNGNIVRVSHYYKRGDQKTEFSNRLSITYGSDNQASLIVVEDLDNYGNVESITTISDIVWEKTDGQIYDVQIMSPYSKLLLGDNRIKRASVMDDTWLAPIDISVEYKDSDRGYYCTHTQNGKLVECIEYEKLDDAGSYKTVVNTYSDDDSEVASNTLDEIYVVDKYGLVLKNYLTYYSGQELVNSMGRDGEVIYDTDHGFPVEYTLTPNYVGEAVREFYSEYTDVSASGVENVIIDNSEGEYYDISGLRVSEPSRGFYIVKKGNKTSKVFIQ